MKSIINGKPYNHPATIDDESALDVVKKAVLENGFGMQKIIYEEDVKKWLDWLKCQYNLFKIKSFYANTLYQILFGNILVCRTHIYSKIN